MPEAYILHRYEAQGQEEDIVIIDLIEGKPMLTIGPSDVMVIQLKDGRIVSTYDSRVNDYFKDKFWREYDIKHNTGCKIDLGR